MSYSIIITIIFALYVFFNSIYFAKFDNKNFKLEAKLRSVEANISQDICRLNKIRGLRGAEQNTAITCLVEDMQKKYKHI